MSGKKPVIAILILSFLILSVCRAKSQSSAGHPILFAQLDKEVYLPEETVWFKIFIYNDEFVDSSIQNIYVDYYNDRRQLIAHQKYISYLSTAKGQFTLPKDLQEDRIWMVMYRRNDVITDPGNHFTKAIRVFRENKLPQTVAFNNIETPISAAPPLNTSRLFIKQDSTFANLSFHNDDRHYDTITLEVLTLGESIFRNTYSLRETPRFLLHFPAQKLDNGFHEVRILDKAGVLIERKTFFHTDRSYLIHPQIRLDTFDVSPNSENYWHITGLPPGTLSISINDADMPHDPYGMPYEIHARPFVKRGIPEIAAQLLDTTGTINNISDSLALNLRADSLPVRGMKNEPDKLITVSGVLRKIDPRKDRDYYPSFVDLDLYTGQKMNTRYKAYIINDSIVRFRDLFFFDTTIARGMVLKDGEPHPNYKVIFDSLYLPALKDPILMENTGIPEMGKDIRENLVRVLHGGQQYDSTLRAITLQTVYIKARNKDRIKKIDALYTGTYFSSRDAASKMVVEDDSDFVRNTFELGQYIASHTPGLRFDPNANINMLSNDPVSASSSSMSSLPSTTRLVPDRAPSSMSKISFFPDADRSTPLNLIGAPSTFFYWPRESGSTMIYLDEEYTTYDLIRNMPLTSFSYIKVFRKDFHGPYGYIGPAICLYTKKGGSKSYFSINKAGYTMINGYTQAENIADLTEDSRFSAWNSTVYWNPDVYPRSTSDEVEIRFRNNSFSKRYRIIIQGLTVMGTPVYFEKIIAQ